MSLILHLFWQITDSQTILLRHLVHRARFSTFRGREEVVVVAKATSVKEEATSTREAIEVVSRLTGLAGAYHFSGLLARVQDFQIL